MTWWKWGLAALGVVVLAFLAMYAIGATLPVAHTATVSAELDAAPEEVWALISDVDRFPDWRPDVETVTRLDDRDGLPVWREEAEVGVMTFQVEAMDPPHRLVTRIADEGLPFGGTWTYEISPAGEGSRLTITEDGEVYNPLFRFVSRFIFGHESTVRAFLEAARAELAGDG
jgi:uncharacterized protein YndB with AHSA1/START domain